MTMNRRGFLKRIGFMAGTAVVSPSISLMFLQYPEFVPGERYRNGALFQGPPVPTPLSGLGVRGDAILEGNEEIMPSPLTGRISFLDLNIKVQRNIERRAKEMLMEWLKKVVPLEYLDEKKVKFVKQPGDYGTVLAIAIDYTAPLKPIR